MSRPSLEHMARAAWLATISTAVAVVASAYLEWPQREFVGVWLAGGAAAVFQAGMGPARPGWRRASLVAAGWIAAWACLLPALRTMGLGAEGWHASYVMGAGWLLGAVADWTRRRSVHGWAEDLRLASLAALAVGLYRVYLTTDFFGGIDARSYGYAMIDALQQARAGIFPVLVGQGEFMFDGAIHPIRTAPYHQHLGILLDAATAHALRPVAVQHLTVVWTAVQGVLTCYFCLAALEPARRGLAWLFSLFYLCAPAAAAAIYGQEMYMTFMAYAYLPCAIGANLLVARDDTLRHWCALAAALVLVWFCHPPVAIWLSLATLALQGGRLVACDWSPASWARATAGAAVFCALSAGYFWSMFELSSGSLGDGSVTPGALAVAVLAPVAIVRYLAGGRMAWLAVAAGTAGLAWMLRPFFGRWLAVAAGGALALRLIASFRPAWSWRKRLPETALLLLLLGGVAALPGSKPFVAADPAFDWVARLWPLAYQPVSTSTHLPSDVQLGYTLLAAAALGMLGLWRTGSPEKRLLGLAAGIALMLCFPLPGLTRVLLRLAPTPVYAVSSAIAWLRYLPTVVTLATFAGFLGFASWRWNGGWRRWAFLLLAAVGAGWSLRESQKFPRQGFHNVNTRETIDAFYRPENARQFAYIFAGMPVSPYLTNGVVDYHLESRLLRADDPKRELATPMPAGASQVALLRTGVDSVQLVPTLVLDPGEHVLVQFEFFDRPYEGTLVCQGPKGFYREYPLPASGFFEKSFGVAPARPKTIALWNERPEKQPVAFAFVPGGAAPAGSVSGDFARVTLTPFEPDRLPVRTRALIPAYRAEVDLGEPAYLETPRAFIPGYRARVNGHPAAVEPSPNGMAMVRLERGSNQVEVRYAGTSILRSLMALSLASWLGLGLGAWRWRSSAPAKQARTDEENAA